MWPFLRAVLAGVLAGASPPMLATGGIALSVLPGALERGEQVLPLLVLAVFPLVYAIPLVLVGSIIIGLPVAVILRKRNSESAAAYVAAGAVGGFVVPLTILLSLHAPSGSYWLCFLGAFSGGVTGATWWTARKPRVA